MCEKGYDEIDRLVALRRELRSSIRPAHSSYGNDYAENRERGAYGDAARKVERSIVEAMGGVLVADLKELADARRKEEEFQRGTTACPNCDHVPHYEPGYCGCGCHKAVVSEEKDAT